MKRYCESCRDFHEENELCPKYKKQLKEHPEWLAEVADFTIVAGEYHLASSQALDGICKTINKIAGTNLSFEGSHQAARDVQVFARLNSDSFRNSGQFANAEAAKQTFDNASEGFKRYLRGRLNGTGEEIDWLRSQRGKINSLINKSSLPDGNVVGYDGETVNRLTGNVIKRTSIKAAEGSSGLATNARDIVEALEKGTLNPNDAVTGVKGTNQAVIKAIDKRIEQAAASGDTDLVNRLTSAKKNLKINELGTTDSIKSSTERQIEKIKSGKAHTSITTDMVAKQAAQGAVIGAAISLTVSSITNYIKYKNGKMTREEAFREIGEDSVKGLITGGAMGAITLFLQEGAIGFVAGIAIGIYISSVTGNILDEVFGKGAYEQILHTCGYIAGTAKNVTEMLEDYGKSVLSMHKSNTDSKATLNRIEQKEKCLENRLSSLNNILEDL